jgi:hypothetical protein
MKNKFVKNIPRNILIMLILIYITFRYLLRGFSRKEVIYAFLNSDKKVLAFGIVLSLIYMICEGFNTKSMLEFFGYKTNIFRTVNYAFTGYFFSGLTPSATGGQPMQMVVMKTDGIKVSHSSIILMIELCAFQLISICMAIIGFFLNYNYIFSKKGVDVWIIYAGLISNSIVFLFIFFVIFSRRFVIYIKKISFFIIAKLSLIKDKNNKRKSVVKSLEEYRKSAMFIKTNKLLILKVLLVETLQILSLYSISYIVYLALGFNSAPYYQVLFLQALAYVSVSSIPLPGAIGVSEKLLRFLFLIIYSKNIISEAVMLTRVINFYMLFIISALAFFISFGKYIFKHKEDIGE